MDSGRFTADRQREFTFYLVVSQEDITPYGSASFTNYFRWYSIARDALLQWRLLGFDESFRSYIETEVLSCNIQFKREAMLQDEIVVKVNTSDIKEKEFTLLFTLIRKDNALLISLGKQRIRFFNTKTNEPLQLPITLVQNILEPLELDQRNLIFKY